MCLYVSNIRIYYSSLSDVVGVCSDIYGDQLESEKIGSLIFILS